jgi:hypothetical protein
MRKILVREGLAAAVKIDHSEKHTDPKRAATARISRTEAKGFPILYQVFGVEPHAAALRDTKKAAGRPPDRQDVAVIVAMLRKRPAPTGGRT